MYVVADAMAVRCAAAAPAAQDYLYLAAEFVFLGRERWQHDVTLGMPTEFAISLAK